MTTDFRSEVFKLCKKVQRDEIAQMIGKTIHDMSVVVEKKTGETIKDARSDFAYLAKHSNSEFHGFLFLDDNIIKTNYPVTPRQKRSRCRSNRGIIDSPTPLFTPFCRFRYRSRGQTHSHQYPRTSSTNDPFLKWFSYTSRMMRIAMSTSPF